MSVFFSFFLVLRSKELVADCCKCAAYERSYDEYPNVLQCVTANQKSRSDGTSRINGCAGVADSKQMNQNQCQTDDDTSNCAVLYFRCYAQDRDHEDESQDDLDEKGQANVAVVQCVGTKAALFSCERKKNCSTCCSAQYLCDHVAAELTCSHFSADQHCQGYSRVYMASGYIADGVSHRNDHKTECKCSEEIAGTVHRITSDCCSHSAAEEYQNESSDEFRYEFFHDSNLHI